LIAVEGRMAENKVDDAIFAANRALESLGVKMPRKVKLRHVLGKLIKAKIMLRNKTDDDILSLPTMRDRLDTKAVTLIMHMSSYCLMKDEGDTAVYSALPLKRRGLSAQCDHANDLGCNRSCSWKY
jgi:hypothetical protein